MKSLVITLRSDVNLFYDADNVAAKNHKEQTKIIVGTFSMMMLMMLKYNNLHSRTKLTFLVGKMCSFKTTKIVMAFFVT